MSFDDAIRAMSSDALRMVRDGQVIGLGSGRAATMFVGLLAGYLRSTGITVSAVPTSLQIKLVAQSGGIQLAEADRCGGIDITFDGADQISARRDLIKGGGGALLRENILASASERVVIMADGSKFAERLDRPVPVEAHPMARTILAGSIKKLGGSARLRLLDRGYPFVTENGNIILDCDFGMIDDPQELRRQIIELAGVMEVGIFARRPDTIYRAGPDGRFDVLE